MKPALAVAALLLATAAHAGDPAEKAAVDAADAWLKVVDAGEYAASWDEAAPFFKGAVGKADWEKALKGVRSPLGKLVARKVASRTYTEAVPGAPDGKYVVVQYETSFENKKHAIETVTPMLAPDGRWRVSGYFIR
jgi:opacity protein-like surface antigen